MLVVLFSIVVSRLTISRFIISVLIISAGILEVSFDSTLLLPSRFQLLLTYLPSVISGNISLVDVVTSFGDQRLVSALVGYHVGYTHFFGLGLGSWSLEFHEQLMQMGISSSNIVFFIENGYVNIKPYSYLSFVSFNFGVIGIIIVTYLIFRELFSQNTLRDISKNGLCILAISYLFLAFSSPTSLPIHWIGLALGLRLINGNDSKSKYLC